MNCAVYLNLDGTLTSNDVDFAAVYAHAVDAAGLDMLADEYEAYTDKFFSYFQNGWAYPRRQAITQIMNDHGIDDTGQSEAFADAWEQKESGQATLRDGTKEALSTVKDAGHTLGIATNGTGALQRGKLETAGIKDVFDALMISSELGVAKPHGDFFAVGKHILEADEHIIVSHDIRRDILPAKRAGYHTVWLSAQETDEQVAQLVDVRIDSIDELPDAVAAICE